MKQSDWSNIEQEGEQFSSFCIMYWICTGPEIAEGNLMAPIMLPPSKLTEEYAALHLAMDDLNLARDIFLEAEKIGLPSDQNALSKALINAGVISYNRSFASGLRGFRLTTEFFRDIWREANIALHDYLRALRDKHIAHSVNSYERAKAIGVVVTDPSSRLLTTSPSGIGVMKISVVGLPMSKLRDCDEHIKRMTSLIEERIIELGKIIHAEMLPMLKIGQHVSLEPVFLPPDRSKIKDKRQ